MNINNVELQADFLDADFMELFETAANTMQKRANAARSKSWASNAEAMREICDYMNTFFDTVFGEGTAEKIFHGKKNVGEHFDAFDAVIAERDAVNSRMNNLSNKYRQRQQGYQNRQQRRHQKK